MEIFKDKNIIVGITGSISAYKSILLIRELVKNGANVYSVLTPSAKEFVTPITLANISRNPVICEMFDLEAQKGGAWHIHLVHNADAMIIAPCSANTLSKLANGICDNSLLTLAIALPRNIPLLVAPAMDSTMFLHPAIQRNIKILESYGLIVIPPEEGDLSSGFKGPGRLPEIEVLLKYIEESLLDKKNKDNENKGTQKLSENKNKAIDYNPNSLDEILFKDKWASELEFTKLKNKFAEQSCNKLRGKKILITAGPTYEKIDDVRFIGNFSSGKMGFALAQKAVELGAEVILITGPVKLDTPPGVRRIDVVSAEEMFEEVKKLIDYYDIAILSSAVSDFKPKNKTSGKIKKEDKQEFVLELEKTPDILSYLGKNKKSNQIIVGFALEAEDKIENAKEKLFNKNCDLIIYNTLSEPNSAFNSDYNTITILTRNNESFPFPNMPKIECSKYIFETIQKFL